MPRAGPAIPPRPEDEVKQEKAAAEAKAKAAEAKAAEAKVKEAKAAEAKAKEAKVKEIAKPKPVVKPAPKPAPKPVAKPAAKPVAKPVPAVIAKDDKATQPKPKSDTVMAAGDPAIKQGVTDAVVSWYRSPAFDRRQAAAVEVEPGVYEVEMSFAAPGAHFAFVQIPSLKINQENSRFRSIRVTGTRVADADASGK